MPAKKPITEPTGGARSTRGPSNFRQRDLTAAIKAVEATRKEVVGVEIAEGRVHILTSHPEPVEDDRPTDQRLDREAWER